MVQGKEFSEQQKNVLLDRNGAVLICCAGSGKTTLITNLVAKRIISGEIYDVSRVLCATYSKGGSEELEERINKLLAMCGLSSKVTVKTLHSVYYQIISAFGISLYVITEGERLSMIREACKDSGATLEDEDLKTVAELISIQINEILTEDEIYNSYHYTLDSLDLNTYKAIRAAYNRKKTEMLKIDNNGTRKTVVDFDDLQLVVYNWVCIDKIQQVIDYFRALYKWYFIDEFQDTNRIQFAILKAIVEDAKDLIVVGDDDQNIYSFRGCTPDIILNITAYYELSKHILPVNYRCGRHILKHAATGVDKMSWRQEKDMTAYKGFGSVEFHDVAGDGGSHLLKMSKYVRDLILCTVNDYSQGITLNDMAVLVRNNKDAQILHALLFKSGVYCGIQENMKLSQDIIFKDIMQLLEMRIGIMPRFETILWKLIPYLGVKGGKTIVDMMTSSGCSLAEALFYLLNVNYTMYSQSITDVRLVDIPDRIAGRARHMVSNLKVDSLAAIRDLIVALNEKDTAEFAKLIIWRYRMGVDFMYQQESSSRYMNSVLKFMEEHITELGFDSALASFRSLKQFEEGKFVGSGPKITLSTMHGSKGKEWKMVIILGDDNVACPGYSNIRKYVEKGIKKESIGQYLDGERRLHYVAQTRAIHRLALIADMRQVSVFELECLDIFKKVKGGGNNDYIIKLATDGSGGSRVEQKAYDAFMKKVQNSKEDGVYYFNTGKVQ